MARSGAFRSFSLGANELSVKFLGAPVSATMNEAIGIVKQARVNCDTLFLSRHFLTLVSTKYPVVIINFNLTRKTPSN